MNNNYYYVIESLMFCESGWTLMEKLVEQESDSNKNMDKCFKLGKNMKVHSLFFYLLHHKSLGTDCTANILAKKKLNFVKRTTNQL